MPSAAQEKRTAEYRTAECPIRRSNDEGLFGFCRAVFSCSSEQRNGGNVDSCRSWPNRRLGEERMKRDMPPVHPGEILIEDFLKPLGITQYRLAKSIGVPQRRIGEIVAGKRAITADTALRLAKFFGTDAQSWLNLQSHYDLEVARDSLQARLEREVTPMAQVGQRKIDSITECLP